MKKVLVYGYGNLGRKDDGLGVMCAEAIEKWAEEEKLDWLDVDTNYQLNIEDADTISGYDEVYFVDASLEEIDNVEITEVDPSDAKIEFSMHAVSPSYVLHLCQKIFNKAPKTYLIHIKGYEWDFVEGLTPKAQENLEQAINWLQEQNKKVVLK